MKNYNIVIYIVMLFIGLGLYKQVEYEKKDIEYENQKLKQNDSISNIRIDSTKRYIDTLKNKLILAQSQFITKLETIYITRTKIESVEVLINDSNIDILNFLIVY